MNKIPSDEIAYHKIKEYIIFGYYKPGEHLLETEIAAKLETSRTPVRDALKRLEREGFVIRKPYKGMIVRKFTRKEAREAYEVRGALEGMAAYLATKRIDDLQKEELSRILEESRIALNAQDFRQLANCNNRFHEKLVEASRNEMLIQMLKNLRAFISISRIYVWTVPGRPTETLQEHQELFRVIKSGDSFLAGQKAAEHVNNSWKVAKKVFEQEWINLEDR
jgi:DNA-binding GntR family transcriptional regulator